MTVTTPGGTSSTSSSDQFTYDATPVVTGIAPVAGPIAGNTSVTITGTGFADATGVKFASGNASSYTIVSDIQITAASPAHAAGTVDVTVTNETGTSSTSSSDQFSYDATPAVTAVSPVAGPIAGNTSVTITGTGFVVGSSTVAFGADAGTSVSCSSTTSCSATSPSGSAGTVDVTVTTPGGTSSTSSSDQFTYQLIPTLTAISTSPTSSVTFESSVIMTAAVSAGATGSVDFEHSSNGTTYTGIRAVGEDYLWRRPPPVPRRRCRAARSISRRSISATPAAALDERSVCLHGERGPQTITFTSQPPSAPTVGGAYTLSATATGGSVSFGLDTGILRLLALRRGRDLHRRRYLHRRHELPGQQRLPRRHGAQSIVVSQSRPNRDSVR